MSDESSGTTGSTAVPAPAPASKSQRRWELALAGVAAGAAIIAAGFSAITAYGVEAMEQNSQRRGELLELYAAYIDETDAIVNTIRPLPLCERGTKALPQGDYENFSDSRNAWDSLSARVYLIGSDAAVERDQGLAGNMRALDDILTITPSPDGGVAACITHRGGLNYFMSEVVPAALDFKDLARSELRR